MPELRRIWLDDGSINPQTQIQISAKNDGMWPNGRNLSWAWTTYQGLDQHNNIVDQKQFILGIRYKGWMRGVNACTAWSSVREITLEASACRPQRYYDLILWRCSTDIGGMFQEISGGKWNFENRNYDRIDFEITVTAVHTDAYIEAVGNERDTIGTQEVTIEYIPEYRLETMYYERSDLVVITYSVKGWERKNDRFFIWDIRATSQKGPGVNPANALYFGALKEWSDPPNGNRGFWGYVAGNGRIEIPTSALTNHLVGRWCHVWAAFNADYRPSGAHLDEVDKYMMVYDKSTCASVNATATVKDGIVQIATKRVGPKFADYVTIKLVDGEYDFDEKTIPAGETAKFPYCPFNKELVFELVSYANDGNAISSPTRVVVPPIEADKYRVDAMATGQTQVFEWRQRDDDCGIRITSKGNFELVEFAKNYPSAFFGVGGRKSINYDATLIDDNALKLEQMSISGVMLIRGPDTRRYPFAGELNISKPNPSITRISLSGEVVSG